MEITSDDYNAKYLIGEPVVYTPADGSEPFKTKTRSIAWDQQLSVPSILIEGQIGGVPLTQIEIIKE